MRRKSETVYSVLPSGELRRVTTKPDGKQYVHHCSTETYEQVARAFEESDKGLTLALIAERYELPYTQVNVAMEFMKERGCVVVRHKRKAFAASDFVFEDAMIEYHALEAHRE